MASLGFMFLLASCSYVPFSSGEEETPQEAIVVSLEEGQTLLAGEIIDITVIFSAITSRSSAGGDTTPTAVLTIELRHAGDPGNDEVLFGLDLPVSADEPIPPLSLDDLDLESGEYTLMFQLDPNDGATVSRAVTFYYATSEYAIRGVHSDSPIILPLSTVILSAEIASPEDSDPFIRWMQDGEILTQGYLSEGAAVVPWTAPEEEGIYTVRVDLYPVLPADDAEPPLSMIADLYVFRSDDEFLGDLQPEESYYALLHLSGDLSDAGARPGSAEVPAEFTTEDELRLVTRGMVIGYELDGQGGIQVPELLLPLTEDAVQPFTLTLGFTPLDAVASTVLLDTRGESGVYLRVAFDEDGILVADIGTAKQSLRLSSGTDFSTVGQRRVVSLSLFPEVPETEVPEDEEDAAGFRAVWFVEGVESGDAHVTMDIGQSDAAGMTLIGGPGSPRGIIDEVGVYYKDPEGNPSPDPDIYRTWWLKTDPGAHVFADGFDGMYLSSLYDTTGTVGIGEGVLEVGADSWVQVPAFSIGGKPVEIQVQLAGSLPATGSVSFDWNGSDTPLFSTAGGTEDDEQSGPRESIVLVLKREEGGTSVVLIVDGDEDAAITIEIPGDDEAEDIDGGAAEETSDVAADAVADADAGVEVPEERENLEDTLRVEIANASGEADSEDPPPLVRIDSITVVKHP